MPLKRVVVAAGLAVTGLLAFLVPGYQFDFNFDWLTGVAVVEGVDPHLPVRELAAELGRSAELAHSHPRLPGALLVNGLFGVVPFEAMYMTGRIVTLICAVWLAWLVSRWTAWDAAYVFAVLPATVVVWPFSHVWATSQWAVFAVAALVGITIRAGDSSWAGVPLGLAVTLKLWPWLLVPALWMSGRRRTAAGAAGGFVVVNLAGVALPHVSTEGTVAALLSVGEVGTVNISPVQWLPLWVIPIVGMAAAWWVRKWRAWWVPVALACSPVVWPAYLASLTAGLGRFEVAPIREDRTIGAQSKVGEPTP